MNGCDFLCLGSGILPQLKLGRASPRKGGDFGMVSILFSFPIMSLRRFTSCINKKGIMPCHVQCESGYPGVFSSSYIGAKEGGQGGNSVTAIQALDVNLQVQGVMLLFPLSISIFHFFYFHSSFFRTGGKLCVLLSGGRGTASGHDYHDSGSAFDSAFPFND